MLLVSLDSSIIIAYLQGDTLAAQLFSAESEGRIRFAINPIVLQEILLAVDAAGRPEFERIRDHFRLLPIDFEMAEPLLPHVRDLRNRLVHSNDVSDRKQRRRMRLLGASRRTSEDHCDGRQTAGCYT